MSYGVCAILCLIMSVGETTADSAAPAASAPPGAKLPMDLRELPALTELMNWRPASDWRNDPFGHFVKVMNASADRLRSDDTGKVTQQGQAMILAQLDEVIASLEKACSGSSGKSGTNTPTSPATGTGPITGVDEQGPLRDPGSSRRRWGNLPPAQRQRIIQSHTEGLPPGYEGVLEEYFRRLAEEQMIEAAAPVVAPPQESK